jgi:hypothetical protein
MQLSPQSRLPLVVVAEYLMVLPATVFLVAAAVRLLQPRQFEPSRLSWIIFDWTTTHISRLGAAALFFGMPGMVVLASCLTLRRVWREDQALRQDMTLGFAMFRRHFSVGLLITATLLAGAIFTLALVHLVTD